LPDHSPPKQAKGKLSRERILKAGLRLFGEQGYALATTRHIAAEADLQFPAIGHYFGDKLGLYLACTDYVIQTYREDWPHAENIRLLSEGTMSPDEARKRLSVLLRSFRAQLSGFADQSILSQFIVKAMNEGGPAFDSFYDEILEPALSMIGSLITSARPEIIGRQAKIEALILVGGVSTFGSGAPVVERYLGGEENAALHDDVLRGMVLRLYG
jgi:AcrR family transcriptional regulator